MSPIKVHAWSDKHYTLHEFLWDPHVHNKPIIILTVSFIMVEINLHLSTWQVPSSCEQENTNLWKLLFLASLQFGELFPVYARTGCRARVYHEQNKKWGLTTVTTIFAKTTVVNPKSASDPHWYQQSLLRVWLVSSIDNYFREHSLVVNALNT